MRLKIDLAMPDSMCYSTVHMPSRSRPQHKTAKTPGREHFHDPIGLSLSKRVGRAAVHTSSSLGWVAL
jgi:hypothetical protein